MKCKLTGKEGNPVEAHIIPKSFYRIDKKAKIPIKIIGTSEKDYPEASRKGIYDKTIVAIDGERIFSPWDTYAKKLLIDNILSARSIKNGNKSIALSFNKYDYKKLKLFFLSVLWRASVSERKFFKKVSLGPSHENNIRQALLKDDPGDKDFYPIILAIFNDLPEGVPTLNPVRNKLDGINYYWLYVGDYVASIKVDKGKQIEQFQEMTFKNNSPLYMICREFKGSNEHKLLYNTIKKNKLNKKLITKQST